MIEMMTPETLAALAMIFAVAACCLVEWLTPRRPAMHSPSFAGLTSAAPPKRRGWTIRRWRDNTPWAGRSVRCGRIHAAHSPVHSPFFRPCTGNTARFAFPQPPEGVDGAGAVATVGLLLIEQFGWTQGALARTPQGRECGPLSDKAACFCANGAIDRAAQICGADAETRDHAYDAVKWGADLKGSPIMLQDWNDAADTKIIEVIRAFRKAAMSFYVPPEKLPPLPYSDKVKPAAAILTDAAKLIEDNGWARKWWVLDADGNEVGIYDPAGCQFSLIGAMQRAQPREETAFKPGVENAARREAAFVEDYKARGALIEAILLAGIGGGIKGFDNKVKRTKAEVVAMLRAAAARAEKSTESPPHAWELVRMGLPAHDRGRYSFAPAELAKRARQMSDYYFWEKAAEVQMTEAEQVHSVLMIPAWGNLYSPGYAPARAVIEDRENGYEMLANVIGDEDGERMLFGFAAGVRSIATAMRAIHGKTAAARIALRTASDCFGKDEFPPVIALAKALDVEYPQWDGLGYSARIHLAGDSLGAEEYSFAGAFAADLAMTAPEPSPFSRGALAERIKDQKAAAGRFAMTGLGWHYPETPNLLAGQDAAKKIMRELKPDADDLERFINKAMEHEAAATTRESLEWHEGFLRVFRRALMNDFESRGTVRMVGRCSPAADAAKTPIEAPGRHSFAPPDYPQPGDRIKTTYQAEIFAVMPGTEKADWCHLWAEPDNGTISAEGELDCAEIGELRKEAEHRAQSAAEAYAPGTEWRVVIKSKKCISRGRSSFAPCIPPDPTDEEYKADYHAWNRPVVRCATGYGAGNGKFAKITRLHAACRLERWDAVKRLLSLKDHLGNPKVDPNEPDFFGSPLCYAVRKCCVMERYGEAQDTNGEEFRNRINIVRTLLEYGADPNLAVAPAKGMPNGYSGEGPPAKASILGGASNTNSDELVNLLLDYGANPNGCHKGRRGSATPFTPLFYTITGGNPKAARRLLARGVMFSPHAPGCGNETLLDMLFRRTHGAEWNPEWTERCIETRNIVYAHFRAELDAQAAAEGLTIPEDAEAYADYQAHRGTAIIPNPIIAAAGPGRFSLDGEKCDWCAYNTDTTGANPPRPAEGKCRSCGKPLCHMCARADGLTWHFPPGRCGGCHKAECRNVSVDALEEMLEQLLDPQNGGAGDCLAELVRRAKVAGELSDKVQNHFRGNTMSGVYSDGEAGEREMELVKIAGKISELKRFAFAGDEAERNDAEFPHPPTISPDELKAACRALERRTLLKFGFIPPFVIARISEALRRQEKGSAVTPDILNAAREMLYSAERNRPDNWISMAIRGAEKFHNFDMSDDMREVLMHGTPEQRAEMVEWQEDYSIARMWIRASGKEAKEFANARRELRRGILSELENPRGSFAFGGEAVEHNTDFPPPRRTRSPDEVLARAVVRARKVIADTPRETLATAAALWNANRGGAHNFRENDRMHGIEIGDRGGIFITAIKNGWVDTPDGGLRSGKGDGAPFRVQNRYHQGEWMDCSFAHSAKEAFLFQLSEQRRLPNKPLLKILRALNSLREAKEARWPRPRFSLDGGECADYQTKCRAMPVEVLAEIVRPVLDGREERYDAATWALAELVARANAGREGAELAFQVQEGTDAESSAAMDKLLDWAGKVQQAMPNTPDGRKAAGRFSTPMCESCAAAGKGKMLDCPAEGKCRGCGTPLCADCVRGDKHKWEFPGQCGKCHVAECRKADAEALAVLARGPAERDKNPAALDAINELLRRAKTHDKAHEAGRLEMLTEIDPQGNTVRQCEKCGETYTIIPGGDDSCPNDECENAGRFSMPPEYRIPDRYMAMIFLPQFIDAVEALHPYSKLSLPDIRFAHQHYGARRLPSVLCRIAPLEGIFDDWDEAVSWLREQTILWASNQAKRDAVGNFPTLPRPEYVFLQITAGASPQGQYPKIYPIGGEMERAAVEGLHQVYHKEYAEAAAREKSKAKGRFSIPLAKEMITPRLDPPKRSRITDPRYQISTLILDASRRKDPKAMREIEPDALADVIFTALKRTHPLYRVAADALDALLIQTREYDMEAKRDPRPRSRRGW